MPLLQPLGDGPLRDGVVENAEKGPNNGMSITSSCRAFPNKVNDDNVEKVAKQPRSMTSEALAPPPSEHHSRHTIKTEAEVAVLL